MCYLQRGFIREIASPTGSFFRGITSLRLIRGEFRCATSTGSSFLRDLSHGHNGSYEGWDETTATIRQQTSDLAPPPMLNDVTTTYDDDDDGYNKCGNNGRRGLLFDRNDDNNSSMGLDFDHELNKDDGRTQ